jgi:TPR repeat protein
VNQELYYAKKAADQGHYIAMYNMGIHYLNLSMDENQSQPKEYLKKSLGYFEQSRLGLEKSQQDHRYFNSDLLNDLIDIYVTRLFNFSYYPEIAEQIIAVLKTKAHKRHIAAMCAIARLHFDHKNRPHYYDYAEAVKWCQAAYLQDPEHDLVKEVLYEIMGNTKRSIKKYNQTITNITASDIPGRQDVLI